jgi:hypothetical protein
MKVPLPLVALTVFIGATSINWTPQDLGIALPDAAVVKSHGTRITPVLDEPIPAGQNLLWCATFQLAWDKASQHFGGAIHLQPASKLAASLNSGRFDTRWIDASSIFESSGRVGDGTLEKIRRKKGSPSSLLGQLQKESAPGDLIFYSALEKDLRFPTPFARLGTWKLGRRAVPWFGFTPEQIGAEALQKQVRVHHYGSERDFVIELETQGGGDQLILAKLPQPPKTPAQIKSILGKLKAAPPHGGPEDLLAVPNITADESTRFSSLEGKRIVGGRFIRMAMQAIDFRMNEKGAKLKSEAAVSFGCSVSTPVKPRLMVLTPPFAIMMKRKDAPQPYFVGWFANTDLLGTK